MFLQILVLHSVTSFVVAVNISANLVRSDPINTLNAQNRNQSAILFLISGYVLGSDLVKVGLQRSVSRSPALLRSNFLSSI